MSKVVKTGTSALKELRVHFCQTSPSSQGLRSFIANNYPKLKQQHPTLPILVREAHGVEARIFGRFDFGKETKVQLDNLNESQVETKFKELLGQ